MHCNVHGNGHCNVCFMHGDMNCNTSCKLIATWVIICIILCSMICEIIRKAMSIVAWIEMYVKIWNIICTIRDYTCVIVLDIRYATAWIILCAMIRK